MRPLLQDSVFPVAVTIGGPSELLYLWQIDPIYRTLGIERSLLFPRISASIIPASSRRLVEKLGGLDQAIQHLWGNGMDLKSPDEALLSGDLHQLARLRDELTGFLVAMDNGDPSMRDKAVKSIDYHVKKVTDNIIRKASGRSGSRNKNDSFDSVNY